MVQVLVVDRLHHACFDQRLEAVQVHDHPGHGIRRAGDRDFEEVVVAVSMRTEADAVGPPVLVVGERRTGEPVGRAELGTVRDVKGAQGVVPGLGDRGV